VADIIKLIREAYPELSSAKKSAASYFLNHYTSLQFATVTELAERIGVSDTTIINLCADLGYSKSYLSRLFHEQTGDTIAAYLQKSKIRKAKELIRGGVLNFTQISDQLAFDNPQYFARTFKRITGMTPTQFKRSLEP